MKRVYFTAWASNDLIKFPAYAVKKSYISEANAVADAIASKNGLDVGTVRADITVLSLGMPVAQRYQITLGRYSKKAGATMVVAECWFSIPF